MADLITLRPSPPICTPLPKFGGQPNWLADPQWPLTPAGLPMRFVCQLPVPQISENHSGRMFYLFVSDDPDDQTWDAEAGGNAVVLQPGPFEPHISVVPQETGPTLERWIEPASQDRRAPLVDRRVPTPVEYAVDLVPIPDALPDDSEHQLASRLGGQPRWLQNEESIANGPWRFAAQIDSCSDDYELNFGDAGVGYVFVSLDGRRARFLWQCC
jgi:hypothetical protein